MSRFENLWREECDKIHYVEIGRRIIVILKQGKKSPPAQIRFGNPHRAEPNDVIGRPAICIAV